MSIENWKMLILLINLHRNKFIEKNQPLVEKVSCHPSFFFIAMDVPSLHNLTCSLPTSLTFENVKAMQGYPITLITIHIYPLLRLGNGAINISWVSPNKNPNIKLSSCLNSCFIWIPNVIWWMFMLCAHVFQVVIKGMTCLSN